MATRGELIVRRLVELMRDPQIVDGRVYRDRGVSLVAGTGLPALDVLLDRSDASDMATRVLRHDLRVRLDLYARENLGEPASEVADRVVELMHRALMADRTLGGLCRQLTLERQQWQYQDSGDGRVVVVQQTYIAVHATWAADLAQAAV